MKDQPFIAPGERLAEITIKGLILGVILALIMAVSNTYLALKIGVLTPSSIPAAIISMGILRLFARSNILENNQVQTCASAGEAIAGGVVYTAPALVIIHYWTHFDYLTTFLITIIGGILGVLFTIPLRRVYMKEKHLNFPEGRAIAEVLKLSAQKSTGLAYMLLGGAIGAILEVCQNGFKLLSSKISLWVTKGSTVYGFGMGFSATLIGAGYLMGFDVGLSILLGAIIASGVLMPVLSHLYGAQLHLHSYSAMAIHDAIRGNKLIYVGIGAMLVSGLWTLLTLLKPFYDSLKTSFVGLAKEAQLSKPLRTEKDMPGQVVLFGTIILLIVSYFLFQAIFPLSPLGIVDFGQPAFIITSLIYVLVLGFVFSAICGYFSGLVGVTASPGSSVAIAAVLIAALIVRAVLGMTGHVTSHDLQIAAAITIVLASIVMGAACVANNNSQDLKVGHLVGATPWKQQLMLMVGGLIAALVVPLVMQLLYSVYGIANSLPHAGMNPADSLPAPPAAAMAAIARGVFDQQLPWNMMGLGALIAVAVIIVKRFLPKTKVELSVIGVAIGMYLPLSSSTPLFLGALISLLVKKHFQRENGAAKRYRGMVLSCGLVAGAAIMNVLLAVPFALLHSPSALALVPTSFHVTAEVLGAVVTVALCVFLYQSIRKA